MKKQSVTHDLLPKVVAAMAKNSFFRGLDQNQLNSIAQLGSLVHYAANETVARQGEAATAFGVVLNGRVREFVQAAGASNPTEIKRASAGASWGLVEACAKKPMRGTISATEQVLALELSGGQFDRILAQSAALTAQVVGVLANRLIEATAANKAEPPFGDVAVGGTVAGPSPTMAVMPAMAAMPSTAPLAMAPTTADDEPGLVPPTRQFGAQCENNPKLDALLKRMVAEGASDLHLSAMHKPRWRIDGEIREISEARELGQITVLELFEPIMTERQLRELRGHGEGHDVDFAYALPGVARFRVNLFADRMGISGVLRTIPDKILTFEQLGLPKTVARLCEHPKGMVLVTGPTGSGKSTTLAAMIDYINKSKRTHIITMEDPIEFVHKSRKALINQREMGVHCEGFRRALKSALRQDPDIVLVGELRDIVTVGMAVETANTGHLVFGTLHTATAVSTVERIVDLFPPEQQGAIRAGVAEALKGVIAQTLLRKKGGGRIAALEIMVGSAAISNLIREGKMHHIPNIMITAKKQGNQLLNEELEKLVRETKVTYEEALSKAIDKPELAKRFGREYFDE